MFSRFVLVHATRCVLCEFVLEDQLLRNADRNGCLGISDIDKWDPPKQLSINGRHGITGAKVNTV